MPSRPCHERPRLEGALLAGTQSSCCCIFFAINSYYLVLTIAGFWRTLRTVRELQRPDQRRLLRSPLTPPVSLLAPAFNEQANVVDNVRSLLMLDYPLFEVILVNDGSKDDTLDTLIKAFELKPSARSFEYTVPCKSIRGVMNPLNTPTRGGGQGERGKADALNQGSTWPSIPCSAPSTPTPSSSRMRCSGWCGHFSKPRCDDRRRRSGPGCQRM